MIRWKRQNHERALDEMAAHILEQRKKWPAHRSHVAAIRTTRGNHQLVVHDYIPAAEVRANLEAQLAIINAREGS